jgi:MarR family 2-MHQ and catechol resistance regulon transcriptional repressor
LKREWSRSSIVSNRRRNRIRCRACTGKHRPSSSLTASTFRFARIALAASAIAHRSLPRYSCHLQLNSGNRTTPQPNALQADSLALHEALADLVRAYQFRDRDRICCHDISVTQCYALEALKRDGPMRLNDLAARLFLDKSTSSRVLGALVRKGYAERLVDLIDGRAISVRITAKGRGLYSRIHGDLVQQQAQMIADLTPAARRAAIEVIARLARAAESKFGMCRAASAESSCCGPRT